MNSQNKTKSDRSETYQGFEQGPIRPPSEANSLLIRVTRNCPWNHCTFCPIYKGKRFSLRPVDHVKQDIDRVHKYVEMLRDMSDDSGRLSRSDIQEAAEKAGYTEWPALQAAINWFAGGMASIFIQDANSLIIKPKDLVEILSLLKERFYWVERITSYARSHTIARMKEPDLKAIRQAGLDRIHIGLESGSDRVLQMTRKGVTKEQHVRAGLKVKQAGMELSEYVMPGLGGRDLSKEHARETADALNQINPDFIRLRTLAIPNSVPLYDAWANGRFKKCTDLETVAEIKLFIESLNTITSVVQSDHILNLFEEVAGKLPEDQARMIQVLQSFLDMEPEKQCLYQVGRRTGFFSRLVELESPRRLERARQVCRQFGITPENIDDTIDELMKRFI